MRLFLLRYGEIGTKSQSVRRTFVDILIQNIERMFLKESAEVFIERERGRIFVHCDEEYSDIFSRTFGLVSFSPVKECSSEMDEIIENALDFAEDIEGSFAVRTRRKGSHDYNSQQLAEELGAVLLDDNPKAEVDLDEPDYEVWVEVRNDRAYIFDEKFEGPGGLPLSSQGKVASYISTKNDFIATWMMMKRGARPYIFSDPSTQWEERLNDWDPNLRTIGEGSREEFFEKDLPDHIDGIVLGDRLEDYETIDRDLPIFRPLIALSRDRLSRIEERIDRLLVKGG